MTESILTVPEFFAVGDTPTAVLFRAVKGGVKLPKSIISAIFKVHLSLFSLLSFFHRSFDTIDEFLLLMRAKGYEIKGESFGEDARKYISFRSLTQDKFVRGSARSLGKEYTKEQIKERIEQKKKRIVSIPKKDYASRKQAGKSAKQSVVELEHRIKDLGEIIKYAKQYRANRSYHISYKKAKNPDAYFRRYESQVILYGGAKRMLEQAGINLKSLNVNKLISEYEELTKQKSELTATYKNCEKEVRELN